MKTLAWIVVIMSCLFLIGCFGLIAEQGGQVYIWDMAGFIYTALVFWLAAHVIRN